MFILKDDMNVVELKNLRGGKGSVIAQKIVEPENMLGAGSMFNRMTLNPGCSVGVHDHVSNYEVYYILEGKAKVTDGDKEMMLGPGDAEMCAKGNTHSIENVGTEPCVFMAVILNNFENR